MKFAIVDIETTGCSAGRDRITEIAIFLHDGHSIVDSFSTLINPECLIPPFITKLTGITNEMVEDAPKFYEVAKQIIEITDGATIVAHNAPFDYGFIREEYKSLGFNFTRNYLCTVKLSRRLLPGYRSYSLGNLCQSIGLEVENRHRAAGDALATVRLFELLLQKDTEYNLLTKAVTDEYLDLKFPPGFDRTILDRIPRQTGVYYLYNDEGTLLYVGKSKDIRTRILSHFRNKQSRRALEMRNAIADIDFEITGDELIALLLESEEIKKRQPMYNRAQRQQIYNIGIYTKKNDAGYYTFSVGQTKKSETPVLTVKTKLEASNILERMVSRHRLCKKLCGLYDISHACLGYSSSKCNGACIGEESVEAYNKRVEKAIAGLHYKHPDFMIIGKGRSDNERSVIHVEHGQYQGFGFFDPDFIPARVDLLKDVIDRRTDNRDVHNIIRSFLRQMPADRVITY